MLAIRRRAFGPGLLVTAAFIGPGTVTTASRAGAGFGFAVAWALVFAVVATIVLQEMSARLGLVTREGLGDALRTTFTNRAVRVLATSLVVAAIAFGNAAFQMGNITGAGLGLEALTGVSHRTWACCYPQFGSRWCTSDAPSRMSWKLCQPRHARSQPSGPSHLRPGCPPSWPIPRQNWATVSVSLGRLR